jgi:hypothetical protein
MDAVDDLPNERLARCNVSYAGKRTMSACVLKKRCVYLLRMHCVPRIQHSGGQRATRHQAIHPSDETVIQFRRAIITLLVTPKLLWML